MIELLLAAATLLGGVTAIWFLVEKGLTGFKKREYIFPDSRDDFYDHYSKCISGAKSDVWITSDGFNMRNSDSAKFAKMMMQATSKAMENGAAVNRVQIIETMHLNWLDELRKTLEEHPDKFRVWYNRAMQGIPNVCVIDAESSNCISERMEHELGGIAQGSQAGTFSFMHGDKKAAQRTKSMVENIIAHPATRQLTLENIGQLEDELFNERQARLKAWLEGPGDKLDLSMSGVFDERIISAVLGERGKVE